MTAAEDKLWGLRQAGRKLERYVEDFLELVNQLSLPDAALGACFQLGLDSETIRCELPVCDYPLIELINLVLFLNNSNFEVEEMFQSRRPAPSGARRVSLAHPTPGTPTYSTNGSDRLPSPKHPWKLQSSTIVLSSSPPPPAAPHSSPLPSTAHSSPPLLPQSSLQCRLQPQRSWIWRYPRSSLRLSSPQSLLSLRWSRPAFLHFQSLLCLCWSRPAPHRLLSLLRLLRLLWLSAPLLQSALQSPLLQSALQWPLLQSAPQYS